MQKFVIGRIEGRWDNFLRPIQGGQFRKLEGIEQIEEETTPEVMTGASSSSGGTSSPPPIFDPANADGLRKRRATSISSVSPLSLSDNLPPKPETLDDKTTLQLNPDLSKYPSLDHTSQDAIVSKYRELDTQLRAAGLYDCPYRVYAWECLHYTILFVLFATSLHFAQYDLAGAFLGMF
ncbi:hypothetical protein LTR70_006968 [Exophiala xenobiotica]|uniref:Uncharacterized protein n=1 Tax=Lithohypha guttulata TaxID=1690604 RepID=A0ABR0K5H3_9EURO|nr:hypothetical protein LTR24_006579 [Lithohypha guttulata]KAK5314927.1 hypothetical protein LTR70_006968 [Exophiala xenobiotica]